MYYFLIIELKLNFIELKLNYGIEYCYNRLAILWLSSSLILKKYLYASFFFQLLKI